MSVNAMTEEYEHMREWMKEYTDQLPEYNYLLDELLG